MTLASRITDLVTAIATALNARSGMVGSSAYDLYVAQGGTLTLAQWTLMYQGGMTAAQRAALSGVNLWAGRMVTETDTGITWRYVSVALGWKRWESDWIDPGANWTVPGASIYLQYARYRYRSGVVVYESQVSLLGGPINGDVYVVLPVAVAQPFQNAGVSTGTVTLINSSDNYRSYAGTYDFDTATNRLYVRAIGVPNNASIPGYHMPLNGNPFGEGWSQSDQFFVHIEYDVF